MAVLFYLPTTHSNSLSRKEQPVYITYTGNMGITITKADTILVIDGLHDFYKESYPPSDPNFLNDLFEQKKSIHPFLIQIVSHQHNDHFDSLLSNKLMALYPSSLFFSGSQVLLKMNSKYAKRMSDSCSNQLNLPRGLHIACKPVSHINPAMHSTTDNFRSEINWGNLFIVHLGDADIKEESINGLENRNIDVLIIPEWFAVTEKGKTLLNRLKAKQFIVTHIENGSPERKYDKGFTAFRAYGQSIIVK